MSISDQLNRTDGSGNTPLHKAAEGGYVHQADDCLNKGADVNKRNNDGETPLDVAQRKADGATGVEKADYLTIFALIEKKSFFP